MIEDDAEHIQELESTLLYAAKGIEAAAQSRQAIWINPSLLIEAMSRIYNAREYMRERNAA